MTTVERRDGSRVSVGTVYGIGRNYAAHARELGNALPEDPVVFLKARSALRGPASGAIAFDETFHHEVEIVLLIGARVPLASDPGWDAVEGVALGLDLTRREVQTRCKEKGLPWVPAKSFAGSAVVGPFLPRSEVGDLDRLAFTLDVAGERKQEGNIRDQIFSVPKVLAYLASLARLEPGDLVFTGTPEGVGPIRRGDAFRMELITTVGNHTFDGRL